MTANFTIAPASFRLRRGLLPHVSLFSTHACVGLLGLFGAAVHAGAEEAAELAPLVITSTALYAPVTVEANPKTPRQPVPASDGADYLKTIPGFSAVRNGGVNGDPAFRGMFGSRVRLLDNGGEMLGACPNRMDSPSSYISPENYDRLIVIKGPQTVLWGPGASAATVRFEREPEQFQQPDWRLDSTLLAGSNGRFDRRIDAAAGSVEGYARLLASSSQADDYEDGDGDTVPSRFDKWSTEAALGWTPDANTLLELSLGRGDGEARYAGRGMDGAQFERDSLALRFESAYIGDTFHGIEAQLYYNHADHIMDNYSLRDFRPTAMMPGATFSRVDRRTLGGRLIGTWRWTDFELKAGVDGQRSEHRKAMDPQRPANQMTTLAGGTDLPWVTDARLHNVGLFGEANWALDRDRRLIGGLRLDRAAATDERDYFNSHHPTLTNMMGMPLRMNWANPHEGKTRRQTLHSGFVRYERDLRQLPATWYAGLGHAERFPDYWELFVANPGSVGSELPFDTVRPEKTTQLDVGLQYRQGALDAWVSAYAGVIEDYILFTDVPGVMAGMTRSVVGNVDAQIAGAEAGASYRLAPRWKTDLSLAYAWGKNTSEHRPLPQIPPLETRLGLTYQRGDWSASGLWRLVAAQDRIAEGQGTVVGRDFDESAGFGVLSVNGTWRVNPELKLSAGIDNLLDKTYSEHLNLAGNAGFGFPGDERINEPGRTGWVRLDLSF